MAGSASTFTLPIVAWPAISPASSSIIGAIALQGPHQGAQKSSRTGQVDSARVASRVAVVMWTALSSLMNDLLVPFGCRPAPVGFCPDAAPPSQLRALERAGGRCRPYPRSLFAQ